MELNRQNSGNIREQSDSLIGRRTLFEAWEVMLDEMESVAQVRSNLAESLTANVSDPLKIESGKHEEARKKVISRSECAYRSIWDSRRNYSTSVTQRTLKEIAPKKNTTKLATRLKRQRQNSTRRPMKSLKSGYAAIADFC
jgi:hypothetical protein